MDETGHDMTNKKLVIYKFVCEWGGSNSLMITEICIMNTNSKTNIFINLYKYSILMCIV
jgi:hypothetical protein